MKTSYKILALAILISASIPRITTADYIPPTVSTSPVAVLSVPQMIVLQSQVFTTPEKELTAVAKCESGFSQSAIGKAGEIGIFQYMPKTFTAFSSLMGETLDIHSAIDQAKLTAWIFKNHPEFRKQWTCWRSLVH